MRAFGWGVRYSAVGVLLLGSAALAVRPQAWSFSTEKDFAEGAFDNTVVDSYGQLALSRALTAIETDAAAESVAAFVQTPDGAIYVATGHDPKIFRIDAETNKSTLIYKAPKGYADITAMAADAKGNLLVALAGGEEGGAQRARLVRVVPGEKPVASIKFENDDVDYIWAIAQGEEGAIYLGTGPHGKVYKLAGAEGGGKGAQEGEVVLESTAHNVTALAWDKAHNLIAGTDGKGLVIRVDGKTGKPFILLDAGKVDITAIVAGKEGNLFVATAKADLSGEGEESPPEETETKSKPGMVIPEPAEPPADDGPNPGAKKKGHAAVPAVLTPGIYGETAGAGLPPELKDLVKKLQQKDPHKQPPASNKKPGLPRAGKAPSTDHGPSSEGAAEESADASAVYRIGADGAVTTIVQEADQNYALLLTGDGDLLVGTGDEAAGGKLFRYRMSDESLTLLARLKQEQITALFATAAGETLVGTANGAQVYRLESTLAKRGSFTSQVLDASHAADFGHAAAQLVSPLANGGKITLATRSSNSRDADGKNAQFWSDWSAELDLAGAVTIASPAARYLQYRITLTGDGKLGTPVATNIKLSYQTQNLPPRIKSVDVETGARADTDADSGDDQTDRSGDVDAGPRVAHVTWDATDPNNDTLSYRLYYRAVEAGGAGDAKGKNGGEEGWSPLARDIKDSAFEWDTRAVGDGRYQVKVIASDKPDNSPESALETARVSAPFTVNHTAAVLGEIKAAVEGDKVSLAGEATDGLSAVVDVRFQIDSQGDWQPAAASDKIFDSLHEAYTIVTKPLAAGSHRITVRATDAAGNVSYKTATVTVKPGG